MLAIIIYQLNKIIKYQERYYLRDALKLHKIDITNSRLKYLEKGKANRVDITNEVRKSERDVKVVLDALRSIEL